MIRYDTKENSYRLEDEKIVERIAQYKESSSEQLAILLIEIDGQIIGKTLENSFDFTATNMTSEEVENLSNEVEVIMPALPSINVFDTEQILVDSKDILQETLTSMSNTKMTPRLDSDNEVSSTDSNSKTEKAIKKNENKSITPSPSSNLTTRNVHNETETIDYTRLYLDQIEYYRGSCSLKKEGLFFLIKSKDGSYAYSKDIYTNSYRNVYVAKEGVERVYYKPIGGLTGGATKIGSSPPVFQFEFKSDFYSHYSMDEADPLYEKDLNYILNWLHYWTDSEISIVDKGSTYEMYNYVKQLNTQIKYEPKTVDYTRPYLDQIEYYRGSCSLKKEGLFFLIKSKDGSYAYSKDIYTNSYRNVYVAKEGVERVYHKPIGGSTGGATKIGTSPPVFQFEFISDFYSYYDMNEADPLYGKDLNYILNWLHYWTDSEISIVDKGSTYGMYNYVKQLNTKIKYEPKTIDYTRPYLDDIESYRGSYSLKKEDLFFLIKSKDGSYAYSKDIYTNSYRNVYVGKEGVERVYYKPIGGVTGGATKIGASPSAFQFEFKPDFYSYYDMTEADPLHEKDLNYVLNWLHYWTDSEISIVSRNEMDIFIIKKNRLMIPWYFFDKGRTSKKDQFYSFSLSDTTRLTIELQGNTYKQLTLYNKQERKVFEKGYSSGTDNVVIDLPAGEYYISMTGITSDTTFQMTRSQFKDWQLSTDWSEARTQIYVGNQYNQALTELYAPYHKSTVQPSVVQVTNTLAGLWKQSKGKYPVLDTLFGTNYLLNVPSLTQPTLTNLGYMPLGNTLHTSPISYIGQGHFYSKNQIFTTTIGPQQRFGIVDDLLFWLAVSGVNVAYSAYVANNNNLTMTMPFATSYDPGKWSWSEQNDWHYDAAVTYEGERYGVNEKTGEIRNTETGAHLPSNVIPDHIKAGAAGITIGGLMSRLSEMDIKPDDDFEWYTFKDLVKDELEGVGQHKGHTIEKHVMKSDEYLLNRVEMGDASGMATSYYDVGTTLIAINYARIVDPIKFENPPKLDENVVDTVVPFPIGRGIIKGGKEFNPLFRIGVKVKSSTSNKGYRIYTSYPLPG
ncbi:hypothetical protein I6N95_15395 [Vagococcus sp. BWB3-3]|uniref:Bacterial CdiA-CT RNAse A domain-containing protein n=1 Tax=Vagococcus allomyrinae TaxID=2794353 RepID=A0A940SXI2_9ENTE|nr:RNase A-like domain-containing protein [Vagococcus allomyrinae]MBP1042403.1 hypothetical protein [Vagococcus allomyrinae]